MIQWLDWLDDMAPGWDFSYPEHDKYAGVGQKDQFVELLREWAVGRCSTVETHANMKVCMTENQMMAHKLAWDVKRIESEPFKQSTVIQ